jgi:putative sigma-54 modulation protein
MKLNKIQAQHMDLTDPIREYAWKKITELEKFLPAGTLAQVDILLEKTTAHHQNGDIFKAEVNVSLPGQHINAEAVQADLYAAIDKVRDEVKREMKEYKERLADKLIKGGRELKEKTHTTELLD